jgi:hypothetical protein
MNEANEQSTLTSSTSERSPAVEQAERQLLGNGAYQKAEVVHNYASTHPWVHPTLIAGLVALVIGIAYWLWSRRTSKT